MSPIGSTAGVGHAAAVVVPVTVGDCVCCRVCGCCAVRGAFFFRPPTSEGVYFHVRMMSNDMRNYVLGQLPDWLFFSAYTFLLLLW